MHGAINQPKGIQQPHIPLLIAGGGEQVTLKLVAQYGDACNVFGDPDTVAHKFAVLKKHCESIGRDYNSVHRTVQVLCALGDTDEQAQTSLPAWMNRLSLEETHSYALIGSPETIRRRIAAYEEVGVQELVLIFSDAPQLETIRRFAREFIL